MWLRLICRPVRWGSCRPGGRSGTFVGMSDTSDHNPPTADELEAELEEVEAAIEKAKHSEHDAIEGERPKDWT